MLLELLLLDSDVSLPRDDYDLKMAADRSMTNGDTVGKGGGGNDEPSSAKCTLMVLVMRAENLPMVRG